MRYALVTATGTVSNVVLGDDDYTAPEGLEAIMLDGDAGPVSPGWQHTDSGFEPPGESPPRYPDAIVDAESVPDALHDEILSARDAGDVQQQLDAVLRLLAVLEE